MKCRSLIFPSALFTFFSLFTVAQPLDSLYSVWQDKSKSDSVRVIAYTDYIWNGFLYSNPDSAKVLAEALHTYSAAHNYLEAAAEGFNLQGVANYVQGNYPQALKFYEKALAIDEKLGNQKAIASSLNNIGSIYANKGNLPRALEYYEKSLAIKEVLGDKKGIANSRNNIGNIYHNQGSYPRALQYYQKALVIREEIGDKRGTANSLNNIGIMYKSQGDYHRALDYYQKSIAIREEIGDKQGIANSLGNIGIIYKGQGDLPRALESFERALTINEELGEKQGIEMSLNNVGSIYQEQGDYSHALEYYQKSLEINEEIGDTQGIANCLNNIGSVYQKQGHSQLAIDFCQKALDLFEEVGVLKWQKDACQCLYDTYKAMGKGQEALVYLEKINAINDSLKVQETTKKLEQMEFAKIMLQDSIAKAKEARLVKEAHHAEVRKKNQTRNVLIGCSLFLLFIAVGFYARWSYVRKSKAILQTEKDRAENLLLNILPAEIAEELKQKGRADARDFNMVSILFTDFKGFTEASAKLSAQDLVAEVNSCFEAFDGIISKYGIEKIKTIGDAYMAAGGLPVPTDDSVKNTVLAALDMQAFIIQRKSHNETHGKPAFEMRVGIHTGPVVAGIVGVKKFQYDIWGDTVNTASRMESSGAVGKVNISEATYDLVKNDFHCEFRGEIEAKGKGKVKMYFVTDNQ